MAAIVFQYDKRSGLTYAYKSISYWDKEKMNVLKHPDIIFVLEKSKEKI